MCSLKCPMGWGMYAILLLEVETGGSLELIGQPARPNQGALDLVKNTSLKKDTVESKRSHRHVNCMYNTSKFTGTCKHVCTRVHTCTHKTENPYFISFILLG